MTSSFTYWAKFIFHFGVIPAVCLILSIKFHTSFSSNDTIISIVTTLYSLVAVSMFSVASILASPSMMFGSTWRGKQKIMDRNLDRVMLLYWYFVFCILTLCLLMLFVVAKSVGADESILWWISLSYMTFTVYGIYLIIPLLTMLHRYFRSRLKKDIEHAQKKAIENKDSF